MTKRISSTLVALSIGNLAWASTPPSEQPCNCNCKEETSQCLEPPEFDFRHPERGVIFEFGMLEGKDPGRLVIRRTEPISLRYEHRFARWLYLYVTFKTELTDLTYYNHYAIEVSEKTTEPLTLDLQVGLRSRWNRIGGAGMRFIPYQSRRLTLNLSLGFEEMALADVDIKHVYFIHPLATFELAEMTQDHARIRYNWRKLDFETRLDWNLPWLKERFTPHLNLGAMLVKSDIEIWYDEWIAQRIADAGSESGIIPIIPNHETFYVFAPSVGIGLELRITDHVGIDVSGSTLPFSDRTVQIGTLGLILRQ